MSVQKLLELYEGRADIVHLADIPFSLLTRLNQFEKLQTRAVMIKRQALLKSLEHKVPLEVIADLQRHLDMGLIIREHERPRSFIVSTEPPFLESRIKIACKIAALGNEIWISSAHLTKPKQTRSLVGRGMILQRHM